MKTQHLSIRAQEDALFSEWEKDYDQFSKDGMVDENVYLEGATRIMFVLKETNGKRGFDLRSFLKKGGRRATWQNVVRWTYGIRSKHQDLDWSDARVLENEESTRMNALNSLCVMNVKKVSGGSQAIAKKIREAAERDAKWIKRQFDIYSTDEKIRPQWVIACGKGTATNFVKALGLPSDKPSWRQTSHGVKYMPLTAGGCLISFYHPQARIKHQDMYTMLMDAVREIRKKHLLI